MNNTILDELENIVNDNRILLAQATVSNSDGILAKVEQDQHPTKHIHIYYNEYEGEFWIEDNSKGKDGDVVVNSDGKHSNLPKNIEKAVKNWIIHFQDELVDTWNKKIKNPNINSPLTLKWK
jgi:hypothetical protein